MIKTDLTSDGVNPRIHDFAVWEGLASPCLVVTRCGKILHVNPSAAALLHAPIENLLGKSLKGVLASQVEPADVQNLDEMIQCGLPQTMLVRSIANGQPARAVQWNLNPLPDAVLIICCDVSSMHQAVVAQREQIDYLNESQRFTQTGSFEAYLNTDKIIWSAELCRIFGIENGSPMTFARYISMIHPEDRDTVSSIVGHAIQAGSSFVTEERIVRPDGEVRHLETHGRVETDAQGKAFRVIGACIDVTERMRIQKRLLGMNMVLEQIGSGLPLVDVLRKIARLVEENIADARTSIMLMDEDGRHLRVVVGDSLPEEYNKLVDGLEIGPRVGCCGAAAYLGQFVASRDTQTDANWEPFRQMTAKHDLRSCWSMPMLARNSSSADHRSRGKVLGTFATYGRVPRLPGAMELDIVTQLAHLAGVAIEREQALRDLRESERRFRELTDSMPQMIWVSDPGGNPILGNRRMRDAMGSVAPTQWLTLVHPDEQTRIAHLWQHSLATGEPYITEHRFKDARSGEYHWFLGHAVCVRDANGGITAWYGASMNIDPLKRAEETLRAEHTKLLHLSRVAIVGELMSGIAHEINQPLGAILLYAETCRDILSSEAPDRRQFASVLESIIAQIERARETISRMRRFVRRHPLKRSLNDLNHSLRQALRHVNFELRHGHIELSMELSEQIPPVVIDPVLIEQVVVNLVLNSIAALSDVSGRRRCITLKTALQEDKCVFSVTDNGPGVSAELKSQLFEAFVTNKPAGLGLGLSISRSIIEQHGGRIWCETPPGGGASFVIELPLVQEAQP